ncbi:MAG: hypothetical protein ACJAT9_001804 [Polaribacter sp.]|jgi:hypothetical protein
MADTATNLNTVKKSFPALPPNSKPIAIPLFLVKQTLNQSKNTTSLSKIK